MSDVTPAYQIQIQINNETEPGVKKFRVRDSFRKNDGAFYSRKFQFSQPAYVNRRAIIIMMWCPPAPCVMIRLGSLIARGALRSDRDLGR